MQGFGKKLFELGLLNDFARGILDTLGAEFTLEELEARLRLAVQEERGNREDHAGVANGMVALARANYEIEFDPDKPLSARVILPSTAAERKGIEDARFVEFRDEDGERTYYATYTAFDGEVFFSQLLETKDFLHFKSSTLNDPEVKNKGMALFPRKVNGRYAMLSRQDNENIYLMYSDMLHFWFTKELLMRPTYTWEYVQLGNCGSPIETEAGWLLLTHGERGAEAITAEGERHEVAPQQTGAVVDTVGAGDAFAGGVLSGSQVPKFVGDYRQHLTGRLEQAKLDLAPFQAIADRFHGGSLEAMIDKHLRSSDPTFRAEGQVIADMSNRVGELQHSARALDAGLVEQLHHLAVDGDPDIARATLAIYDPGLVLTVEALLCALGAGLLLAVVVHGLLWLMRPLFRRRSSAGAA